MWWCRALAAVLVAALLYGCGFRPLHGGGNLDASVSRSLAQIHVAVIPDRIGQKLRNFLLDRINAEGQPARPLYSLEVKTNISRTDLGIERDETATRAIMVLTAKYNLFDIANRTNLVQGTTQSTNSFNIVASDFATLSGETDALDRAAREVSDDIRIRLGLYFSRHKREAR
jgi:LPS-assembly lipoprotein